MRETYFDDLKDELIKANKKITDNDLKIRKVIEICTPYIEFMWASKIISELLECDFRESGEMANIYLRRHDKQ